MDEKDIQATKPTEPKLPSNIVSFTKRSEFQFKLSDTLLNIGGDSWTIGDAVEGVQIFGGTGSGKTSGSGQTLAKTYLYNLFGGLVLTVKAGDALMWEQYCKDLKRSEDLVMIILPPLKISDMFRIMKYSPYHL